MTTNPDHPDAVQDALDAADYLADRYEQLWKGKVVRDLAEAIAARDATRATLTRAPQSGAVQDELLPCPFCGHKTPYFDIDGDEESDPRFWVECIHCAAKGPEWSVAQSATEAWNARATLTHAPIAQSGWRLTPQVATGEMIDRVLAYVDETGDDPDYDRVWSLMWEVVTRPIAQPESQVGEAGLEAENARLREALERIAGTDFRFGLAIGAPAQCADIARAALESTRS